MNCNIVSVIVRDTCNLVNFVVVLVDTECCVNLSFTGTSKNFNRSS